MLEYHTWIEYIFSLKRDSGVARLMEDQASKPGWDKIGDADVKWETSWWEQFTDEEWNNWWGVRQEWSDEEWEEWW
eukprot:CAMPEP_0115134374 /NCGR_PEP_ID=MMETSP0227-20121206/55053_1 /TAXON_ID=89957 /ORGANISM="Polarella glacialis, Strain CCMP 1383" /LENGTH=75 /DNA_ID=CAMNT_0002540831 /DNA_START=24 /DNA_END=248 /DNA_ORIENTATION=+